MTMPVPNYDDPELFGKSVSAITLKGEPRGYLEDCLSEYDVDITVAQAPRRGLSKAGPWLGVCDLEECSWSHKIKVAHLASDLLEGSTGIYCLSGIEDLVISIRGKNFHESDVEIFQNAIGDLRHLQRLRLLVAADAVEEAKERLYWPFSTFLLEIQMDKPMPKVKKSLRRSNPQA